MNTKQDDNNFIYVGDCETTPFKHGEIPTPFAIQIYSSQWYKTFWGYNCSKQFLRYIRVLSKRTIWFHNGGKFDFYFFLPELEKNEFEHVELYGDSRIYSLKIGDVTLKDSYPLLRIPLAATNEKEKIDYTTFTKWEKHKHEIQKYLHQDCVVLHKLLTEWLKQYQQFYPSIATAAHSQMKKFGTYLHNRCTKQLDEKLRPYYFGGRVQAFTTTTQNPITNITYADINSCYPTAMLDEHPISASHKKSNTLPSHYDNVFFAEITCQANNIFPTRHYHNKTSYDTIFPTENEYTFYATSWEIQLAELLGLLSIKKVHNVYIFQECASFKKFVYHFYKIKQTGNEYERLLGKLLLNSAYGKFGINPAKFKKFRLLPYSERPNGNEWKYLETDETQRYDVWYKNNTDLKDSSYLHVGTAASITSHARKQLTTMLSKSYEVAYCDTDAIFAKYIPIKNTNELGGWKKEKVNELWIADKKRYCVKIGDKWFAKCAGAKANANNIIDICKGNEYIYYQEAPTFHYRSRQKFITRSYNVKKKGGE